METCPAQLLGALKGTWHSTKSCRNEQTANEMNSFSKRVFRGRSVSGAVLGTEDSDMEPVDKKGSLPSRSQVTALGRDGALFGGGSVT